MTANFLLQCCLEDVNAATNSISSLSRNLDVIPRLHRNVDLFLSFLRELKEIKTKKLKENHAFSFIARDIFVALAIVVELLWHPIFMKVSVPFWFYCKLV